MSLSPESVVAASAAWSWVPDNATTTETDEYLLVRYPDYFEYPLELIRFHPAGPVEAAVAAALDQARQFGLPELYWMVKLGSPPGVAELLAARGATVAETVDVLALDLSTGRPRFRLRRGTWNCAGRPTPRPPGTARRWAPRCSAGRCRRTSGS